LEGKSPLLIALLFLVSLSLLLLPWKYLPFNTFSAALIFLEIVLFITYSLPPLRLKEKGMLGVVADALYAHAVPVVLAAYTFSLTAETTLSLFPTVLLFVWQMVSGIRNILLHQADDLDYDKKSKVKNFVAGIYPNPFKAVIWNLIRLELLFCLFFFSILSLTQPLFLISVFSILFVSALAVLFHEKGIAQLLKGGWRFFPNNISEKWLPPSVLIALSIIDIRYITILLLHFSLFNVDFYVRLSHFILPLFHTLGKKLWELFAFIRIISSAMLNYSIYYSFLLFGIDLRKEKTSALRYLKKLRNHSK
ncbi:MAG TPA: hypothetical protein VNJ07_10910, partial [Chitinophagales bacterium]|nr:hypothetical protein [Chitinophagales bacterium]